MSSATVACAVQRDQLARQRVGAADERVDEQRVRPVVDFGRRRILLEPALVEHRDAVRHRQRFFLVVRDQQVVVPARRWMRLISICMSRRRFLSSAANGSSSSRMFGLHGERARQRDALLLAAGELLAGSGPRCGRA